MQQQDFLASLGLDPDAPGLVEVAAEIDTDSPAKPTTFPADAHTTPVMDIKWNPDWLDAFPSLDGPGMAAASRHLFEQFKSPQRDRDRHSLLHNQIGLFISRVRTQRRAGKSFPVTEAIKAGKDEREMAKILKAAGVTPEQLAEMLRKDA